MSQNDKIEPHIALRFEVIKKIGSGAYGVVWKVLDKRTKKFYALKKNFDAFQNSTDAQRTFRQIMYLRKFDHPNIIKPIEIIRSMNEGDIYILFEYMDIDLFSLTKEDILGQQHRKYIIYQIAKALYYLHSADLIHRDIKPSNVLVNEDCHAKICDFGLVRSVNEADEDLPPILTQYIATRWYRAPQILLGSKLYSKPADVWSFGCMVGEMVMGRPMFPGNSTLNQLQRVIQWTGTPNIQDLKSLKTDFGREMLDLLSKIKQKSKKQWFSQGLPEDLADLITKTLSFNPDKRPTMLEILKHPYLKQFFKKNEIVQAIQKFTIIVQDNRKLTLNQYRALLYEIAEQYQSNNQVKTNFVQSLRTSQLGDKSDKTVYKNRFGKMIVRSTSKTKEDSAPKNHKETNTVSIKKKYEHIIGKGRDEQFKSKNVKTQEIENERFFPKRKKSDQIVKYYISEKKKKSVSLYEQKKDSELLAKYMYEHRKI